jgi:hypothetical protein
VKKKIIILFLSIIHFSLQGQNVIRTTTPCSDDVLFKTPGRWHKGSNNWNPERTGLNKTQQQEVLSRMDVVHKLLQAVYPEPMGVDVDWNYILNSIPFGEQVKYVKRIENSIDQIAVVERPVASFGCVSGFFRHYCNQNNLNEIWSGYPGETGTWVSVFANGLGGFATAYFRNEDTLTIDGYPVHLRQPLKQNFNGYELFYSKANVHPNYYQELFALIHRNGELPYIPVTRKQYLDKCIPHLTKFYDRTIKEFEQAPMRTLAEQEAEKKQTLEKMKKDFEGNPAALKATIDNYLAGYKTEQEIRKEQVAELIKYKDALLKHYRDELEETTKQNLLDSPAIIPLSIYDHDQNMPIFVEENIGWMVVTENPKYMRKELPKYVPQFFVVVWKWDEWKAQADIGKLVEEKFPFEKLRDLIDK